MHLSGRLDCDLVAVESSDELTLLVEITAPEPESTSQRAPATIQIVLDRSGSMAGDRLDGAKIAVCSLIDRLDPADNFGLVAFDDEVHVVVPAGSLTDKAAVKHAVASIEAGGTTDLSAGYLRGLQEARRVASPAGATVLIVSDGHANAGITDGPTLGKVATEAASLRITTSTLGFGLGYDEQLLAAIANGGQGNELFAEEPDTAAALIAGEVDGLLSQVAQACSLRVTVSSAVQGIHLLNDLPCVGLDDGIMVELGAFYAGETRRLVMRLAIPGIAALGLAEVGRLELTSVSLPDLVQHTSTTPVAVNVVPGDQAAGRVKDPTVTSEALFQDAQRRKKDASRLLSDGDATGAAEMLRQSSADLKSASMDLPATYSDELLREATILDGLAVESEYDVARAAKSASYDSSIKNRKRGRQVRGAQLELHCVAPDDESNWSVGLEEWELKQLIRLAPDAAGLDPVNGGHLSAEDAARVAAAIPGHLWESFFIHAAPRGGIRVIRP